MKKLPYLILSYLLLGQSRIVIAQPTVIPSKTPTQNELKLPEPEYSSIPPILPEPPMLTKPASSNSTAQAAPVSAATDSNLLLNPATQAMIAKNYLKAIDLYRQYLTSHPNDQKISLALIRAQLLQGNYQEAEKLLANYAHLFPTTDEYLKEKARFYALTNNSSDALAILEPLIQKYSQDKELQTIKQYAVTHTSRQLFTPPMPAILVDERLTKAGQATANKNYPLAIKLYEEYLRLHPDNSAVLLLIIKLNLLLNYLSRAEILLKSYESKFPENDSYLTEKARYYAFSNNFQAALNIVTPLLHKHPGNQDLLAIQQYVIRQQRSAAIPAAVNNQDPLIVEAKKALQKNNFSRARMLYQQYLKSHPKNQEIWLLFIRLNSEQGNYAQAKILLAEYAKIFFIDDTYLTEEARYYALTNQSTQALNLLKPLLQKNPDSLELNKIKNYAMSHPGSVASQPSVQAAKPSVSANPLLVKAVAATQQHDNKKAVALYQEYILRNPKDKSAVIALIRLYLLSGDYPEAEALLKKYEQQFLIDDEYLTEKARYYALTYKSEQSLQILNPLLKKYPANKDLLVIKQYALTHQEPKINLQDPLIVEANKAIASKDSKKAVRLYQEYIKHNPKNKAAWITLINLQLIMSHYTDAAKLIVEYEEKFFIDDQLLTEKARYYALTNKSKDALKILLPLFKKDPTNKTLLEIKQYALAHKAVKVQQKKTVQEDYLELAENFSFKADFAHDPCLYARAAKTLVAEKNYKKALVMIDQALQLNPCDEKYLLLRIYIGNQLKNNDVVFYSYQRLFEINHSIPAYVLGYARAASALGCLDLPRYLYRIYTHHWPNDPKPWLEYAYIASWSGDSRAAVDVLNRYYWRFGLSEEYLAERARILASADRPWGAFVVLNSMAPDVRQTNYDAIYAQTTALYYGNQPIEMFHSLDRVNILKPDAEETLGLNDFINTPYRSLITAEVYDSFDSDTVKILYGMLRGRLFLNPVTAILADYRNETLSANDGSGLTPVMGGQSIDFTRVRAGFSKRFNPWLLAEAKAGVKAASRGAGTYFAYEFNAFARINDRLRVELLANNDFYDVSPKALSLAIRQRFNQLMFVWEPAIQTYVVGRGAYAEFSDSNTMKLAEFAPKTFLLANQYINVILGGDALWYNFKDQFNNGYYNPAHYEYYGWTAFFNFKQNDNINYVFNYSMGTQKDETFTAYTPTNDFSFKAYIGIYKPWYLIASASASSRGRAIANNINNENYRIYSFLLSLTRRF